MNRLMNRRTQRLMNRRTQRLMNRRMTPISPLGPALAGSCKRSVNPPAHRWNPADGSSTVTEYDIHQMFKTR